MVSYPESGMDSWNFNKVVALFECNHIPPIRNTATYNPNKSLGHPHSV